MTDQFTVDHIKKQPLFADLAPEFVDFLAQAASRVKLKADKVVFRHGDRADKFYVLVSGRVTVEIPALYGPALEVQALSSNEALGWSWLIPPFKWNFQARAETDCELLEFDGKELLLLCDREPRFGYELVKRFAALMSERLNAARNTMMAQWTPAGFA
ncbi:MAG: cyclic nucleotide-binding domain-containing protein [Pseudomonadota bacterium]